MKTQIQSSLAAEPLFKSGFVYKRKEIHDKYKGNRQNGISVSASHPYIFIFSGQSGAQHGYHDRWLNEDIFQYSGEGQIGDMQFTRGNLALQDHLKSGRRVFLFEILGDSFVRFNCELEFEDFGTFTGVDREGNQRLAIKFFFKKAGKRVEYENSEHILMNEDPEEYNSNRKPNETERKGLVTSRVGQGAYRKSILFRWEFKCAVTKFIKPEILIASHIHAWKDSTNDQRLDVDNGILLSPNYDALFDQHLISFEDSGKIILSKALTESNYHDLGVTGREQIIGLSTGNKFYLDIHRQRIAI